MRIDLTPQIQSKDKLGLDQSSQDVAKKTYSAAEIVSKLRSQEIGNNSQNS
jgi:hypothetical protein